MAWSSYGTGAGAAAYSDAEFAADTVVVLDDAGVEQAVLVSYSSSATWSLQVAAQQPDRVLGLFALSPACGFSIGNRERAVHRWDERHGNTDGWATYNKYNWLEEDHLDFLHFFFGQLVVGDEAWEVDYFLHENPELKRSVYAWLTDWSGTCLPLRPPVAPSSTCHCSTTSSRTSTSDAGWSGTAQACLPYEQACDPSVLAAALGAQLETAPAYRPVQTDGARNTATLLARLL